MFATIVGSIDYQTNFFLVNTVAKRSKCLMQNIRMECINKLFCDCSIFSNAFIYIHEYANDKICMSEHCVTTLCASIILIPNLLL